MELTGTNRPRACPPQIQDSSHTRTHTREGFPHDLEPVGCGWWGCEGYGGHSGRGPPGPIPNPVVKPPSADGTALWWGGRVGHRRTHTQKRRVDVGGQRFSFPALLFLFLELFVFGLPYVGGPIFLSGERISATYPSSTVVQSESHGNNHSLLERVQQSAGWRTLTLLRFCWGRTGSVR